MITDQTLPHSYESEMIILGCAITSKESLEVIANSLERIDFYFKEHQVLFTTLQNISEKNISIDIHLLSEELKRQNKLSEIGGEPYLVNLAQYAGTSVYVEEYVSEIKRFSILRKIALTSSQAQQKALEGNESPENVLSELSNSLKDLETGIRKKISITNVQERLQREEAFLNTYKGKKYLGLKTSSIEEFNENFLGLRGLNLLAAAPNVGKTALALQLGLEVLLEEKDTCLVFVSLEMSAEEIFRRMILTLAQVDYRTFVFGKQEPELQEKIQKAKERFLSLGNRLQIIDQATNPKIDAKSILSFVQSVKATTRANKALVVVDYLQVWPHTQTNKYYSENEADKWRIGEMKKLRDALSPDPIIVISEARKPSFKENTWGENLSDVMGSARGTYTPDVVLLLTPLSTKGLQTLWKERRMPELEDVQTYRHDDDGLKIKRFLEEKGISLCKLEAAKARDGMQKFSVILEFHFRRNKFKKLSLKELQYKTNMNWSSRVSAKGKNSSRSFADLFVEV